LEGEHNKARSAYDGIVAVQDEENVGDGDKVFGSPYKFDFHIAAGVNIELLEYETE